jgi:hypothetical protein
MLALGEQDWRDREIFLLALLDLQKRAWDADQRAAALRGDVVALRDSVADLGEVPEELAARADSVVALAGRIRGVRSRVYGLAGAFNGGGVRQGSLYPPTQTHRQRLSDYETALKREVEALESEEAAGN